MALENASNIRFQASPIDKTVFTAHSDAKTAEASNGAFKQSSHANSTVVQMFGYTYATIWLNFTAAVQTTSAVIAVLGRTNKGTNGDADWIQLPDTNGSYEITLTDSGTLATNPNDGTNYNGRPVRVDAQGCDQISIGVVTASAGPTAATIKAKRH